MTGLKNPKKSRDPDIESYVYQAISAASNCWVGGTGSAVFDDRRATGIAEGLIAFIEEELGAHR